MMSIDKLFLLIVGLLALVAITAATLVELRHLDQPAPSTTVEVSQ
jgi:hypothetical protein